MDIDLEDYFYFPYSSFRKGQKKMLEFIMYDLKRDVFSFVHAPTGIGKTASALGAALKYAEENSLKVFFLTNRHEHHRIVFDTVQRINERYRKNFKVIDIFNKKLLCNQKMDIDINDFHDYCKSLRKDHLCYFYENTIKNGGLTSQAKISLSKINDNILRADYLKRRFEDFCPYEMILSLVKQSDVIIADYYYLFNEGIRESFLGKLGIKLEDIIVIVDEAHNLPERVRRMNDLKMSSYILKRAIIEVKSNYPDIARILTNIGLNMESYIVSKARKENTQVYIDMNEIINLIEKEIKYSTLIDFLYDVSEKTHLKGERSYANSLKKFLEFWEMESKSLVRIGEYSKRKDDIFFYLRIADIDITSKILSVMDNVRGGVFMSGTLYPVEMYAEITGLKDKSAFLELDSPFPLRNRKVYIVRGITTKYEYRDIDTFKLYGDILSIIGNNLSKNIIFFFPSYEVRERIEPFLSFRENKIIIREERDISKEDKDKILSLMKENRDVVLLAVTGANFYEGVDFKEEMAEIVGIVGIPFEKPDLYTKAIINYYNSLFKKGKLYGYIIPTLNKVIQSAGRIIRGENEKGIIFFLDDRYSYPLYFSHLHKRYGVVDVIHHSDLINEIIKIKSFLRSSIKE